MQATERADRGSIIGAFFFPDAFHRRPNDPEAARWLERVAGYGVNTIFTESEVYDQAWIALAHSLGLRWFASIACFSDHANHNRAVQERPELWPVTETGERRPLMEWYVGITPTYEDYAETRLQLMTQVAGRHAFDGFMLDFIRWPVHWELECRPGAWPLQASFDPHTVRRFEKFSGLRIPDGTPAQQAAWILGHATVQWIDFKCHVITSFVGEAAQRLRKVIPSLDIGVFVVPLDAGGQQALAGQRVLDLVQFVDYVAPMAYHAIMHRPPAWVEAIVQQTTRVAPGRTLPVLQVDSREGPPLGSDWGPSIPATEWEEVIGRVLSLPEVCGCVAFTGTALELDERGRMLKRAIDAVTAGR